MHIKNVLPNEYAKLLVPWIEYAQQDLYKCHDTPELMIIAPLVFPE